MHIPKQKKMYMLVRSLRTCERKSIDAALLRFDELLPSFGPEMVTDAHTMLVNVSERETHAHQLGHLVKCCRPSLYYLAGQFYSGGRKC